MGLCLFLVQGVLAATGDSLVFSQTAQGAQTIYLYQPERDKLVSVVSGAKIAVFLQKSHFYYFLDHQLFEYNLSREQAKLLYKFTENEIQMRVVADDNDLNQLLIVAATPHTTNWYILDVNETSLRKIDQPYAASANNIAAANTMNSPDKKYTVTFKGSVFGGRINLLVKQKKALKDKIIWELPANLSVMPELVNWSPDAKTLLFHAKPANGFEGFYALYALHLEQLQMRLIADSVLYRDLIGSAGLDEFYPSWSADSRYAIFQSQPTGSPTQSALLKYDVKSNQTTTLTTSKSQNQNPRIAPSGNWIAFLSNRVQGAKQLYIIDQQGNGLKRLTTAGETNWAEWFKQ
jgi:DNA-binding beta-propeller fold protein YncE